MSTPNDAVIEYWLDSVYWLDGGANIHSRYTGEVSLEGLGFTGEEWDNADPEFRDEVMREHAFAQTEWGYSFKE